MFNGCEKFNGDITTWDTSSLEDMQVSHFKYLMRCPWCQFYISRSVLITRSSCGGAT